MSIRLVFKTVFYYLFHFFFNTGNISQNLLRNITKKTIYVPLHASRPNALFMRGHVRTWKYNTESFMCLKTNRLSFQDSWFITTYNKFPKSRIC